VSPVTAAAVADRVQQAAAILGERADTDVPLAPMTTYRVGGAAALFVRAHDLDDLAAVAAARATSRLPVLVVGRGSNLLVADEGFAGIAVSVAELAAGVDLDAGAAALPGGLAVVGRDLAKRPRGAGG